MQAPIPPRKARTRSSFNAAVGIVVETRHYRESLVAVLGKQRRLNVFDLGSGNVESLKRLLEVRPEVLLVDLRSSLSAAFIRDARRNLPSLRVLAINASEDEALLLPLFESGMTGFVSRSAALEEIFTAVRDALRGELHCAPRIVAALVRRLNEMGRDHKRRPIAARLTPREEQVLTFLGEGLTNKEIADRLDVEPSTIKNHVHNILQKLSTHRRGDAVATTKVEETPLRVLPLRSRTRRRAEDA